MYYLLGLAVVFACFAAVNLVATTAVWLLWRMAGPAIAQRLSPSAGASLTLWLRVGPAAFAALFAAGMVAPAYLIYEPLGSGETVGITLALISVFGASGLVMAALRVVGNALATRGLSRQWLTCSRAEMLEGLPISVIRHPFPVMAVVGVLRPRIFVSDLVTRALDDEELKAAIAHEHAHLRSRDNLKRALSGFCRDLLVIPFGLDMDREWTRFCEAAADRAAVSGPGSRPADLASALVKIARLVPRGAVPALPAGAYIGMNETDLADRVGRLIDKKVLEHDPPRAMSRSVVLFMSIPVAGASAAALAIFDILRGIHDATELLVHTLR